MFRNKVLMISVKLCRQQFKVEKNFHKQRVVWLLLLFYFFGKIYLFVSTKKDFCSKSRETHLYL